MTPKLVYSLGGGDKSEVDGGIGLGRGRNGQGRGRIDELEVENGR